MELEKAIEHLDECMSETEKILYPEVLEAHALGIEALERIVSGREKGYDYFGHRLPGETKE